MACGGPCDKKVGIWGLGVLTYEMLIGMVLLRFTANTS